MTKQPSAHLQLGKENFPVSQGTKQNHRIRCVWFLNARRLVQAWATMGQTKTSFYEYFARALRKSKNEMMYDKLDSQDYSFLHVSTDACPSCCAFPNLSQSFPMLCCPANVFQRLQVQVSTPGATAIDAMANAFSHGPADFVAAVQALRSVAVRRIASRGCRLGSQVSPQVTPQAPALCWDWQYQYPKIAVPTHKNCHFSHFSMKLGYPKTHAPSRVKAFKSV